jgi:hypothetical protein
VNRRGRDDNFPVVFSDRGENWRVSAEGHPLAPRACKCERPVRVEDANEECSCLKCGSALEDEDLAPAIGASQNGSARL